MESLFIIILGILIGLSSSLLGLGGNVLIVPILPLISELQWKFVIPTGILTVFIVTLLNVLSFYKQKLLDLKLIALLFFPISLFSYISSYLINNFSEQFIKVCFVTIMSLMVAKLIIPVKAKKLNNNSIQNLALILAGSLAGFLAGITGIGSGLILAPLLLGFNMTDPKKVSPTINFLIMSACFFSSVNYLSFNFENFPQLGSIRLDYVFYISIPAIISSMYGRKMNLNIADNKRKVIMGSTLFLLVIKEIFF